MKESPTPCIGFEPANFGLVEHDPLDCNINANVFLLLFSLIYHPLQSQQVHLRGQVSFAVCQWKISVAGSKLSWVSHWCHFTGITIAMTSCSNFL